MITLATLPKATEQEVFDQVINHLRKQGGRSTFDEDEFVDTGELEYKGCAYRGSEGRKCAAGCLIGDDEYSVELEGQNWEYLSLKDIVPRTKMSLITELQYLHDNVSQESWNTRARDIAEDYGLNYTPPKEVPTLVEGEDS